MNVLFWALLAAAMLPGCFDKKPLPQDQIERISTMIINDMRAHARDGNAIEHAERLGEILAEYSVVREYHEEICARKPEIARYLGDVRELNQLLDSFEEQERRRINVG